jgi:hypothetical protein
VAYSVSSSGVRPRSDLAATSCSMRRRSTSNGGESRSCTSGSSAARGGALHPQPRFDRAETMGQTGGCRLREIRPVCEGVAWTRLHFSLTLWYLKVAAASAEELVVDNRPIHE